MGIPNSSNQTTISDLPNQTTIAEATTQTTIAELTTAGQQAAPPTQPPPVELIPGFPATDDIQQFIDQLQAGRNVVGKQSKRLGDAVQKLLDSDSEQRAKDAAELATQVSEWVDEGEIDPVVAAAAYKFLADLGAGLIP